MTREEVFETIYDACCTWYDMRKHGEAENSMVASGQFHECTEHYMLVKQAKVWSAASNEYLYIFDIPKLDIGSFTKCVEQAKNDGEQFIVPDSQHRCSYITALFICDSADPDALEALRKYRYRKDFALGFKGWEEVHCAMVYAESETIYANRDGRNTETFLNHILHPKKKSFLDKIKGVF